MFIYSKKIIRFIQEIEQTIKEVLSREIGLIVTHRRFYDSQNKYSYPIKVVIYNNKKMLGYFNPDFFELGFNELLMHSSRELLTNIIRHEVAHYMTFIEHGGWVQPHGAQFLAFCQRMGWNEEVYRATHCLENETNTPVQESTLLRKVQKLMALSTSSNQNEAEQAMIKSQQLLLKHNIDAKYLGNEDEEKVFLKRILKQKKEDAKMRSIAKILETFFVNTVYSRSSGFTYLEIVGSLVNIEIADYVANFLHTELDQLWARAKKQHTGLKGMIAKNSFFLGIARGYCNKISALKKEYNPAVTNAVMVIEKKLIEARDMVYRRLSSSQSSGRCCPAASILGEQVGRQLSINPGLGHTSKNHGVCLTHQKT